MKKSGKTKSKLNFINISDFLRGQSSKIITSISKRVDEGLVLKMENYSNNIF